MSRITLSRFLIEQQRMVNRGAETLFGLESKQFSGRQVTELLPDVSLDNQRLAQLALSAEEIHAQARHADGSQFYISLIASPLVLGNGHLGTLVIIRDNHDRQNHSHYRPLPAKDSPLSQSVRLRQHNHTDH